MSAVHIYVDTDAYPVKDEVVRGRAARAGGDLRRRNFGLRPSRYRMIRNVVVPLGPPPPTESWSTRGDDVVVAADIPLAGRALDEVVGSGGAGHGAA